ncbi:MAG: RIP metalloprotease RseP [Flavobacteriales bacterium]
MEGFWIKALQLILSLSILVILHELGHFIPARLFKTRVEKFFLFFDWPRAMVKRKYGDTVYGIGVLPLGGYVKIAGMVDERMDKAQIKVPPKPWEFRSKPAWQRLIIMIGGVAVNVLLAFFIYAMLLYANGEQYLLVRNMKYGVVTDSIGHQIGFENGDKILEIDGSLPQRSASLVPDILLSDSVLVARNGKQKTIYLGDADKKRIIEESGRFYIRPRVPYAVARVVGNSEAERAGLRPGDRILAIAGKPISFADEVVTEIPTHKGDTINLMVQRGDRRVSLAVFVPEKGKIGILGYGAAHFLKMETKAYGFFASFPAGVRRTHAVLNSYIEQFKLIFNPDTGAYKSLGGVGTLGKLFPDTWNWSAFWGVTAFLSIALAFLNILPIPALDGGHVVFVLWELITGKKPHQKVLEYAQIAGFCILMTLILYANGNDLIHLIFNR